jgi:DNA-binding response OmpR family regulator
MRESASSPTARPAESVSAVRRSRLLVVDDDPEVRRMLVRFLEAEAYEVDEAATGPEAIATLKARQPELVILDVNLSTENGFDVLQSLKQVGEVAVILLTARAAEADRVVGLRLGADDYVVKPFSPAELAARVVAVLRRTGARPTTERQSLDFGELAIDLMSREVRLGGQLVEMTAKEFDLLAFFARSPRQVFTRDQLLSGVWASSSEWQDAGTVTEHVRRIRRKIEAEPDNPRWVRTVRGVGYRFEP